MSDVQLKGGSWITIRYLKKNVQNIWQNKLKSTQNNIKYPPDKRVYKYKNNLKCLRLPFHLYINRFSYCKYRLSSFTSQVQSSGLCFYSSFQHFLWFIIKLVWKLKLKFCYRTQLTMFYVSVYWSLSVHDFIKWLWNAHRHTHSSNQWVHAWNKCEMIYYILCGICCFVSESAKYGFANSKILIFQCNPICCEFLCADAVASFTSFLPAQSAFGKYEEILMSHELIDCVNVNK